MDCRLKHQGGPFLCASISLAHFEAEKIFFLSIMRLVKNRVYDQLTSPSSANPQSDELTSSYSQLHNCGNVYCKLMKRIPSFKVLEPL